MTGDITPAADDPQTPGWGGLSWSEWQDFDEAHRGKIIPATPGIYRFRRGTSRACVPRRERGKKRAARAPGQYAAGCPRCSQR